MKQYILVCDEIGMSVLAKMLRADSIQFLEVQGMTMGENNHYNLLVTPVVPQLPVAETPTAPETPVQP